MLHGLYANGMTEFKLSPGATPKDDRAALLHLLEEHEVHDGVGLVVLCQLGVQYLAQHVVPRNRRIHWLVVGVGRHEAAIQQGLRFQVRLPRQVVAVFLSAQDKHINPQSAACCCSALHCRSRAPA